MEQPAAVSAILIADTLLAHYFAVARRVGSALGAQDQDEFEVQVGEANRTYPAIWDHLDQARALLLTDGRAVPRYDELRAFIGPYNHAGVSDIDVGEWKIDPVRSLANLGLTMSRTITVKMNIAGALHAQSGSEALKAAMPEVDWATVVKAANAPVADLKGSRVVWMALAGVGAGAALLYLLVHGSW